MRQHIQKLLDQRSLPEQPYQKRTAFWELRPENTLKLDGFKRDYSDPAVSLREMLKRYGCRSTSTHYIRRVAERLGLPARDLCAYNRRTVQTTRTTRPLRPTVETIQTKRAQLLAELKSLDVLEANLRVDVKRVSGNRAVIRGLGDPLTLDLDTVRTFVQGGGLGKLRDLVGKETGAA